MDCLFLLILPQIGVHVVLPILPQIGAHVLLPILPQISIHVLLPILPQIGVHVLLPILPQIDVYVLLTILPQLVVHVLLPIFATTRCSCSTHNFATNMMLMLCSQSHWHKRNCKVDTLTSKCKVDTNEIAKFTP